MKYSKAFKEQMALALLDGLPFLWDGSRETRHAKSLGLCYAVQHLGYKRTEYTEAVAELIRKRLGNFVYVEGFLAHKGCIENIESASNHRYQIQEYRVRWLHELVRELRA